MIRSSDRVSLHVPPVGLFVLVDPGAQAGVEAGLDRFDAQVAATLVAASRG